MTNEQSIDDTESLRSALQAILEEAATNDVEIEGASGSSRQLTIRIGKSRFGNSNE